MTEVELDAVAAHVAKQIDQRRDGRIDKGQHGREDDRDETGARFPPRACVRPLLLGRCGLWRAEPRRSFGASPRLQAVNPAVHRRMLPPGSRNSTLPGRAITGSSPATSRGS